MCRVNIFSLYATINCLDMTIFLPHEIFKHVPDFYTSFIYQSVMCVKECRCFAFLLGTAEHKIIIKLLLFLTEGDIACPSCINASNVFIYMRLSK